MKKKKARVYTNVLFRRVTSIYLLILVIFGTFAISWACKMEQTELDSRLQMSMKDIYHVYESRTEEFWQIYMPIFNNKTSVYDSLKKFFMASKKEDLSPFDKSDLLDALQIVIGSDSNIKWIGVYSGKEGLNYLLFKDDYKLTEMYTGFPFYEEIRNKGTSMEIYGSKMIENEGNRFRTFALCGGTHGIAQEGNIIVGYATNDFLSALDSSEIYDNIRVCLVNEFGVVYDSFGEYTLEEGFVRDTPGYVVSKEGKRFYVGRLENTKGCSVIYILPWIDWVLYNHTLTPFVFLVILIFWIFSLVIYRCSGSLIVKKISKIQFGLHEIGENRLDYRIPVAHHPKDEFESICLEINEVARRLKLNIDEIYFSRMKQREAELMELQAKFDPHFLYNTLLVIRGKVYENGDTETADIIVNLAQIFRNLLDSEQFVTIQDELEFCNLYMSLLKYRYDDQVTIIYDIDSEILNYGIVRNLLQPILENYFVHGFCLKKADNKLLIRGKIQDGDYIHFIVKDNGLGIVEDRLNTLRKSLDAVETGGKSSYGLKNVNRRVKLFYGPDCFLNIDNNDEGGATIEIRIRKLTCEEHEARMRGEE